ncbi:MAG: sulfatase [Verrucomicrobiota bacterium]
MIFQQVTLAEDGQSTKRPPNIVMIMVDDLGLYDLNCYGYEAVDTPNANQLARDGMLFTHAYAGAPVCSPSRAATISGQSPARLHLTNHISNAHFEPENAKLLNAPEIKALPPESITFAEKLRDAGYACRFFGKWHLSLQKPNAGGRVWDENTLPDAQGFDQNIGGNGNGGPASWFSPYKNAYMKDGEEGEYLTYRLASEVEQFMEDNKDRPFLVTLWNYNVHSPLETTEELTDKYRKRKKSGARIGNPVYAGMLEATDIGIGRVLDKIDELGLRDDTIVVLTSDNGGFNNLVDTARPMLRENKGWLYDGGLRVPLIVRWPGKVEPGSVTDTRVNHLDFFPTFMEVASIEVADDHILDGESIVPVLTASGELERDRMFFHYPNYAWHAKNRLGSVVIEDKYKLLYWFDDDSVELYDIDLDPSEKKEISSQNPELSDRLKKRLKEWLVEVDANLPIPNPNYVEPS